MSRNASWWSLAALVALSSALRLLGIEHQSFWIDEIASLSMSQDGPNAGFDRLRSDVHPPLYFGLLGLWTGIFGVSEASVRMLSVLPSVAAVVVLRQLGTRLYGSRAGWIAAGLACVSLLQVYYAQEGRSYAWLMLFALLSTDALVRWRIHNRGGAALAYVLWTTALIYTHYFGFFLLAAQGLYMLTFARPAKPSELGSPPSRRSPILAWSLAAIAIGALFLPWLPVLLDQVRSVQQGFWIGTPDAWVLLRVPLLFLSIIGPWTTPGDSDPGPIASVIVAFIAVAVALWIAMRWNDKKNMSLAEPAGPMRQLPAREAAGLLWLWFLVPPVAGFFISQLGLEIFTYRNTVIASPAFLLLLAASTHHWRNALASSIVLAALVAPSIGQMPRYYGELHKDPWREVGLHLAAELRPSRDAIAFDAPFIQKSFDFYTPGLSYRKADILGKSPEGVDRVWLLRAYAGPNSRSPEFIERWGFQEGERKNFLEIEVHRFDSADRR